MNSLHRTLLGIFGGIALSAALFLIASPPRGAAVELLPAPTAAPILVHVDGAVRSPGVYSLAPGSRVQDAVAAAKGFTDQAELQAVNLAAPLKDEHKVYVPVQGEQAAAGSFLTETVDDSPPADIGEPVNINTAGIEELSDLPGIGPTRAEAIIQYRQEHGGFQSIDDIFNVPGIGPTTFERLRMRITIE